MNLAACRWIISMELIFLTRYGSQIIDPYSNVERTNVMYASLLQSKEQFFRFRLRKPSVEFAFLKYY